MQPTMTQTKAPSARKGRSEALRRHAGGAHHDQFGIAVQPVQRVEGREEQSDRRDHVIEGRQGQAGTVRKKTKIVCPLPVSRSSSVGPA